jgi:uncharacterized membrane protein YeaQ/YmgE (transglycosylase-associated protein family)
MCRPLRSAFIKAGSTEGEGEMLISAGIAAGQFGGADLGVAVMYIIAWIILGFITGLIANKLVSRTGAALVTEIVLGIMGAVVGGATARLSGMGQGVTVLNIPSLTMAITGAVLFLVIYHAIRRTARVLLSDSSTKPGRAAKTNLGLE